MFLSEERTLGHPFDWIQPGAARLWRFNLHYFEWAWSFVAHADRGWSQKAFQGLWRSWSAGTPFGHRDAWSPYVASLRAWNLCGAYRALVAGSEVDEEYVESLRTHLIYIKAFLERDLGGNHLLANLKALVALSLFLREDHVVDWATEELNHQVKVQVLADGGHCERSPYYHAQVLKDIIEVRGLLVSAGAAAPPAIDLAIPAMRRWLGTMLMPDGGIPLFQDAVPLTRKAISAVDPVIEPSDASALLPSGYVVARPTPRLHFVADVGGIPRDVPGHSHAGALSFELAVDGRRLICDTGTSTYERSNRRTYERSTPAHNTVQVDGVDQSEIWGVFRVGRRAKVSLEEIAVGEHGIMMRATHNGYQHLPGGPLHQRTFHVCEDAVHIEDLVSGRGRHDVCVYLHLDSAVHEVHLSQVITDLLCIEVKGPADIRLLPIGSSGTVLASGFGRTHPATTVMIEAKHTPLPVHIRTTILLRSKSV